MGSPLKILDIIEVNNKSVTVIIDGEFLGNENFSVYKISDNSQKVSIDAVEDSVSPSVNKRVIITEGINYENSELFETGVGYTLKITRGKEVVSRDFTVGSYTPPPNYADVKVYGDRIIKVELKTPVQHLDQSTLHSSSLFHELDNFYLLYFGLDTSGSESANPTWLGTIRVDENNSDSSVQSFVRASKDLKSVEIQFNTRSIPIGKQQLIVNYSKNQTSEADYDGYLEDFSDDQRAVPVMNKEFTVVKDDVVAVANNCKALSRTEIIISYDKPVILYPIEYRDVLYSNGIRLKVKNVTRYGNKFKELKFELDNATPLNINFADIKIGIITDANGYKTSEKEFLNIPVPSVPPRIISLVEEESSDPTKTKLVAYWSEDMNETSVEDKNNYKLSDTNNQLSTILALNYNYVNRSLEVVLEKVSAGKYIFHAQDVEDVLGEVMNPQDIEIIIEDRTIPKVEKIVFRNNAFVIKFDERMSVVGEHSAAKSANYRIEDKLNSVKEELYLTSVQSFPMNNNKWIRFRLKDTSQVLPYRAMLLDEIDNPGYVLNIGYPLVKEIRYVEDVSKNIYPLCDKKGFNQEYEELDIANATKKITSDSQLILTYSGDNELFDVSMYDFIFENNITPISAKKLDWKTIEFSFPQGTFNGNITSMKISTIAKPQSQDIFGYPIKGLTTNNKLAINGLSPELKGVSLVSKGEDNGTFNVTLRFVFSKFMRIFKTEDIKITLNNSQIPLTVPSEPIPVDLKQDNSASIFDVLVKVPYSISLSDVFMVSLANTSYIQSKDTSGNTLSPFLPTVADKFIASGLVWNKNITNDLRNNSIEITYNKAVNPNSLISGWNGSSREIGINNIQFTKIDTNRSTLSIVEPNSNFGSLNIYTDASSSPAFIESPPLIPLTNQMVVSVKIVNGNKLVLTFANNETALVNPQAAIFAEYIGNSNIVNDTNKVHLYAGYRPTHIFQNPII